MLPGILVFHYFTLLLFASVNSWLSPFSHLLLPVGETLLILIFRVLLLKKLNIKYIRSHWCVIACRF